MVIHLYIITFNSQIELKLRLKLLCLPGVAAIHLHLKSQSVGLLHGGDAVWGTVLRLGTEELAGASRSGDIRETRQWGPEVPAADRVAVLRQRVQNGARRHHKAAAGPTEAGGGAGTDIREVEGHVGQNQDHTENGAQTGKQGENSKVAVGCRGLLSDQPR